MIGALWGLAGVLVLLGSAIWRMAPLALDVFSYDLRWYHWLVLVFVIFFMAYAEGYRAFQLGFSPRVAARARYLRAKGDTLQVVLAPLFCMAYFHAPKRRRVISLSVTAGIIVLIVIVRYLPRPWRGIVDAGVVVGLLWGLISLSVFGYQAFIAERFNYSPEISEGDEVHN